jgi:cytochrome P450
VGAMRQAAMTAGLMSFIVAEPLRREPFGLYRWGQRLDPVHASPFGLYVVTSHAAVSTALRHPDLGSDESRADLGSLNFGLFGRLLDRGRGKRPPSSAFRELSRRLLIFIDPPDHIRLRRLVAKAFSPRVAERLEPRAREIVDELLQPLESAGHLELMRNFAYPLPARIICELLGVHPEDEHVIIDAAPAVAIGLDPEPMRTADAVDRADRATHTLVAYLDGLIETRRRQPGDDLLTALVAVEDEGERLSHDELIAIVILLLIAGHETTANLIGSGMLAMFRQPDALDRLRDDTTVDRSAVEELLRHSGPVQMTQRIALDDVELDGHAIPAGRIIVLCSAAANRDPAVFSEPARLVLDRQPNPHVGFGGGAHHCLGAPLARMEARVALTALVRRFPRLRLATTHPRWRPNFTVRGLQALELARH